MGMGIIVRDHYGQVKAAWSFTKEGLFEPAAAEATALVHGLNLCKALLIENLVIEGDSQVVISVVQKDPTSCRYGHLIEYIKAILSSFSRWQIGHVSRDPNKAAHGLAKAATRNVIERNRIDSTPDCICDIVETERMALVWLLFKISIQITFQKK
jgi:ribonuclease HI